MSDLDSAHYGARKRNTLLQTLREPGATATADPA